MILQGCGCGTYKPTRIDVPAETMQKCPKAYTAEDGKFETLFKNHIEVRGQYEECKTRHNALVDRINELNTDSGH